MSAFQPTHHRSNNTTHHRSNNTTHHRSNTTTHHRSNNTPTIVSTTAQLRTHQHDPTVQPHCMSRTNTIKTTTACQAEHDHSLREHVSNPTTKRNHRLHVSHLLCINAVVMHVTAFTEWPCNLAMQRNLCKPRKECMWGCMHVHHGHVCVQTQRKHTHAHTPICCKRRSQRERSSMPRARPCTRLVHGSQTHTRQCKSDTTPQSSVESAPSTAEASEHRSD